MPKNEDGTPRPGKNPKEEFGWEFHRVPLLIALVLTVVFYVIVYWLASLGR